jgi:short-subunit dehydrogenase
LAGPLVVITGASSGIGLALARAFAKEGNALLLIARHMKPVDGLPTERTAPTTPRWSARSATPSKSSARPPA